MEIILNCENFTLRVMGIVVLECWRRKFSPKGPAILYLHLHMKKHVVSEITGGTSYCGTSKTPTSPSSLHNLTAHYDISNLKHMHIRNPCDLDIIYRYI